MTRLMQCVVCQKSVPPGAEECPECGTPVLSEDERTLVKGPEPVHPAGGQGPGGRRKASPWRSSSEASPDDVQELPSDEVKTDSPKASRAVRAAASGIDPRLLRAAFGAADEAPARVSKDAAPKKRTASLRESAARAIAAGGALAKKARMRDGVGLDQRLVRVALGVREDDGTHPHAAPPVSSPSASAAAHAPAPAPVAPRALAVEPAPAGATLAPKRVASHAPARSATSYSLGMRLDGVRMLVIGVTIVVTVVVVTVGGLIAWRLHTASVTAEHEQLLRQRFEQLHRGQ